MVRIDRIYTRSGDEGQTSLGNGQRVSKLSARIVAGGSVDETNCTIGVAAAATGADEIRNLLYSLQQFLFDLGADLCVPLPAEGEDELLKKRVTAEHVLHLERTIDSMTERLQPLRSFILPGGNPAAAALHLARAVCRRAELDVLRLAESEPLNQNVLVALNRLSDLLFVLARVSNNDGRNDVLWDPNRA